MQGGSASSPRNPLFHIRFTFDRTPLRRMHAALDVASNPHFQELPVGITNSKFKLYPTLKCLGLPWDIFPQDPPTLTCLSQPDMLQEVYSATRKACRLQWCQEFLCSM